MRSVRRFCRTRFLQARAQVLIWSRRLDGAGREYRAVRVLSRRLDAAGRE
jgi:hypothetical protein